MEKTLGSVCGMFTDNCGNCTPLWKTPPIPPHPLWTRFSYSSKGFFRHAADLIHGDLPGQGDVFGAALPPEKGRLQVVELADLFDDDIGGGKNVGLFLKNVLYRPDDRVFIHLVSVQILIGHNFIDGSLNLPHVGGDGLGTTAPSSTP